MRWQHWAWVMTDEHSDEDWLALIAGRPRPGADAATQAEATALRAGLLAYREDAPDGELTAPAQRIDKLLHRGREAGVLAAARPDWRARLLACWQRPQGLALAFSVVLGAGVLAMWPTTQPLPTAQERGASANQRITAADPPQRQRELLAALRGADLDAEPYERLGRLGVDVALPPEPSAAQRQVLKAQGLSVPAGPVLMIEILAAPRP